MFLRTFVSLSTSFRTLLRATVLSAACLSLAHAQSSKEVTQEQLMLRLQEAKADPELGERLYTLGRKVAAICANCHAEQDGKTILEVPYLSGQNPAYLVEQIRQFSQGVRKNTFMEGILRAMNRDEMVGMVLFYEKDALPARPTRDLGLMAKGKEYYERICINCHGADGHGNERLPRVAGQHFGYVDLTLKRYRDGSSVRSDANMAFVTKSMTDQEIAAVAAYLETLP